MFALLKLFLFQFFVCINANIHVCAQFHYYNLHVPYSSKFSCSKISWNVENHANVNFVKKIVNAHCKPTPIAELWTVVNFHDINFCDWMSTHEIHEDIVLRKFGTIRYVQKVYTGRSSYMYM